MQDQGSGSRRGDVAGVSQRSVEEAILAVMLAEGSEPVWSYEELSEQFPEDSHEFEAAFNDLRANGVLCVSGDLVKVSRAVRYVDTLEKSF